jgi:hypothetical protein
LFQLLRDRYELWDVDSVLPFRCLAPCGINSSSSSLTRLNKHVKDLRKSTIARYLQLKYGHAITGAYMTRIGKVDDCHGRATHTQELTVVFNKFDIERKVYSHGVRSKSDGKRTPRLYEHRRRLCLIP